LPGGTFVYIVPVSVFNSTATNVAYTDSFASGLNFTGYTSTAGGSASGSTINWTSLPAGSYAITLTGTINPNASGILPNNSSLSYTGGGPISTSASVTVIGLTATPTATPSPTATAVISVPVTEPIPYPNPAKTNGPISVSVSFGQATGPVHLEIFTTAFRKVQDINEGLVNAGSYTFSLNLADKDSIPLANGLYYLVVSTPNGRAIGKILVLR
jgi:hypothetical protein